MTNELIEAIPSPLWLITKPGGYKHINQFGRVYRTRELALRHCDVNEMVVELRLAPAPEPVAVSPDQALRGMDALTEVMARFLHYQDSGEPNWSEMPAEAFVNESSSLPQVIIDRYRNDVKFHSQVTRAVAAILDINRRSLRRGEQA